MKITIRLFAGAAQQAGVRSLELELGEGADVAAARAALTTQMPQLKSLCDVSLWASETEVLDDKSPLSPGSELAMIPPVSGG